MLQDGYSLLYGVEPPKELITTMDGLSTLKGM